MKIVISFLIFLFGAFISFGQSGTLRGHIYDAESGEPIAYASVQIINSKEGVISDEESALTDSFQDGLLAPPVYTRPADFRGMKVPEVLQSGHFANIEKWREEQALKITKERRPDLLED